MFFEVWSILSENDNKLLPQWVYAQILPQIFSPSRQARKENH
jgi:hypothetical protein